MFTKVRVIRIVFMGADYRPEKSFDSFDECPISLFDVDM